MTSKSFKTAGICSLAVLGLVVPVLALQIGGSAALLPLLIIVRISPILALASGVVGLVVLSREREKGFFAPLLASVGLSIVATCLAAFGLPALDSTSSLVYFLLVVHVMAPVTSTLAAGYACVGHSKGFSSARAFASAALFSASLMLCFYGASLIF